MKYLIPFLASTMLLIGAMAPPMAVFNRPTTIRWGNYKYQGYPAKPPVFTEWDLSGRSPKFVDCRRSVSTNLTGFYRFSSSSGCRQVIWVADSVLKKNVQLSLQGFPIGLYPSANTPSQSLTIMKVPGKVFVTADRNAGQYDMNITQ